MIKKCLEKFQNFKEKEKTLTSFQREKTNYLKRKMDQNGHRLVICHRGKNKAAENHVQNTEKQES